MNLHDFLNRFSTGYKDLSEKMKSQNKKVLLMDILNYSHVEWFENALEAYTDQICQKQRENCAQAYENSCGVLSAHEDILNAPQPKPSDL